MSPAQDSDQIAFMRQELTHQRSIVQPSRRLNHTCNKLPQDADHAELHRMSIEHRMKHSTNTSRSANNRSDADAEDTRTQQPVFLPRPGRWQHQQPRPVRSKDVTARYEPRTCTPPRMAAKARKTGTRQRSRHPNQQTDQQPPTPGPPAAVAAQRCTHGTRHE